MFNLIAIVLQVLPVNLFLSRRYAFAGTAAFRVLPSIAYLALPNSTEINANLTNSQWHLALLALVILLAHPGKSSGWAIFDITVISLLSLTGPFSILLLPVAAVMYWRTKGGHMAVLGGVIASGALIQGMALSAGTRVARPLGATWHQFVRITGHQVFLSALFGNRGFWLPDPQPGWYSAVLLLALVLGTATMIYAVVRGPLQLKLFVLFSALVLAASLKWPLADWQVLHQPGAAGRYWFFPMMGFLASVFWMVFNRAVSGKAKAAAVLVLLAMPIGIVRDWRYPSLPDLHFPQYAAQFSALPRGSRFAIPINPGWTMVLIKK